MKQKSLKKNAIYNIIRNLMNIIFPIISFPYASRILMPEGMGKVNFANSIIEYFSLIALLGIKTYASRECAKIRDDKEKLSKTAKEILIINGISTVVSYILFAIALLVVPKFSGYRILLVVCSAKILFLTMGMDWLYTANEEYRYIAVRSVFFQIASLVFLFTFIKGPEDYILYGAMGVFSSVGSNVCNIVHSRKYINIFRKTEIELKKHIKPVLIFFGENLAVKIHTALDSVMLGFLLTDESVGYYSAANKISLLVRQLIQAIFQSLMPRTSYYLQKNEKEKYNQMMEKAMNVVFFFSMPAAFGLFILGEPIIILFSGNRYLPALAAIKIIVPTIVICSFNSFLNNLILIPSKKEKILLLAQCIGAVSNVILNTVFIPIWGVSGAALSTFFVELAITILSFYYSFKYINIRKLLQSFFESLLAALIMTAVIYFACHNIENHAIQTVVSIAVGAAVYAVVMILMKNTTAMLIISMLKKRIKR